MPRFKFRLERVLDVRKSQEEREKMAFAEREAALAREKRRLAAAERAYQDALEADGRDEPRSVEDLLRQLARRERLLRDIGQAQADLAAAAEAWRVARDRLIEARKKRRVLDRLRERRHETWRLEEARAEQAILDEMGTTRFLRRRSEEAETRRVFSGGHHT